MVLEWDQRFSFCEHFKKCAQRVFDHFPRMGMITAFPSYDVAALDARARTLTVLGWPSWPVGRPVQRCHYVSPLPWPPCCPAAMLLPATAALPHYRSSCRVAGHLIAARCAAAAHCRRARGLPLLRSRRRPTLMALWPRGLGHVCRLTRARGRLWRARSSFAPWTEALGRDIRVPPGRIAAPMLSPYFPLLHLYPPRSHHGHRGPKHGHQPSILHAHGCA